MTSLPRAPTGREPRIVVVEDEPNLLGCLETILKQENYRVFAAQRAREAFRHLRANGADLLLTDVKMPEEDGFVLFEWVRADRALSHIPVIFFTGAQEEGRARRLGVFDYIRKPVGRDELLERVFRGICVGVMNPLF